MKYGEVSQVVDAGRNTRKEVLDVATKFRRELQGKDHSLRIVLDVLVLIFRFVFILLLNNMPHTSP